ncbi:MAG: hypothetical protein KAI83_20170 [Thiomargarita sp.]|nr:hypothetical protein [Thiomargarita sp.]
MIIARAIVSSYNGSTSVVISDAGCLDTKRYDLFLGVIALRRWKEPHLVISNGSKVTEKIMVKFGLTGLRRARKSR